MALAPIVNEQARVARREVESHRQRFVGITASAPRFVDVNGKIEWVCDVRVGSKQNQGLVKDCLISQWAIGVVNDVNVPVLVERSEGGRLTIIARSEIRLPNVALTTYTLADLDLLFVADATNDGTGIYRDSFGHPVANPATKTGVSETWTWTNDPTSIDSLAESLGAGFFEETVAKWSKS